MKAVKHCLLVGVKESQWFSTAQVDHAMPPLRRDQDSKLVISENVYSLTTTAG